MPLMLRELTEEEKKMNRGWGTMASSLQEELDDIVQKIIYKTAYLLDSPQGFNYGPDTCLAKIMEEAGKAYKGRLTIEMERYDDTLVDFVGPDGVKTQRVAVNSCSGYFIFFLSSHPANDLFMYPSMDDLFRYPFEKCAKRIEIEYLKHCIIMAYRNRNKLM